MPGSCSMCCTTGARPCWRISRSIPGLSRPLAKRAQSRFALQWPMQARRRRNIHSSAMNVMRELGDWKPLDADNLHEFRLKVKQLRYTLQLDAQCRSRPGGGAGRCAAPHRRLARLAATRGDCARGARPRTRTGAARPHRRNRQAQIRSRACGRQCPARAVLRDAVRSRNLSLSTKSSETPACDLPLSRDFSANSHRRLRIETPFVYTGNTPSGSFRSAR